MRIREGQTVRVNAGFKYGRLCRVVLVRGNMVAVDFCDGRPQEWYEAFELIDALANNGD